MTCDGWEWDINTENMVIRFNVTMELVGKV